MKKAKTLSSVKTTEISLSDPPLTEADFNSMIDSEVDEMFAQKLVHWKDYSAWLCVPNLNIREKPQEWEISLKYKDETVKITGGPDAVLCRNANKENSEMFLRLVACLAYAGNEGTVNQPEAADGCPEENLKKEIA